MKTTRILALAAAFTGIIAAIAMVISLASTPIETTRFEVFFPVVTQDQVTLLIRVFGDLDQPAESQTSKLGLTGLKHDIRVALVYTQYKDVQDSKLKLFLRPQVNTAARHGISIDSISYVVDHTNG